jgi:oxygen-independent coproporphyrinogen III oxidase
MINAMTKELELRKNLLSKVDTIYLGGGTPSLLSEIELKTLFNAIHTQFVILGTTEITLEANPDDITVDTLQLWKSAGINRLSIGCQTFDNACLERLNRIHKSETSIDAFHLARAHGFSNISIDLMFGLPGQTAELWEADLNFACTLRPEHISAYGLTIESKTVFGHQMQKGLLTVPNEFKQAEYYETMMNTLEANGYEQYEISNFCLPNFLSKHNSSYWEQEKYLGIGPSAHSFDGANRMWNHSNNMSYIKAIENGVSAYFSETLTLVDRTHEYLLTSIRTKRGISVSKLIKEFNYPINKLNEVQELLTSNNWAILENGQIKLTKSGKLLADEITLKFFLY